jgi:transposase
VTFTRSQRKQLEKLILTTKKKGELCRAQALLMQNDAVAWDTILRVTGLVRRHIFRIRKAFCEQGIDALVDKRKGKPKELLTRKQKEEIVTIIQNKTPRDVDLPFDFWTTSILADYIEREYEVQYKSKTSQYLLFQEARFSYHTPAHRYDLQDEHEVKKFRNKAKKLLQQHWNKDTVILAADEMVLTTATTTQKVWLPKGQSPYIEVRTGTRKRKHIYGFLNIKTGQEHAFGATHQTMYMTAEILTKIREQYPTQPILLFWDNAGWHKGSAVQQWIATDRNTTIVNFPAYTPEENPQEHVWKKGRSAITHNRYLDDLDTAAQELVDYFNTHSFPYTLAGYARDVS